MTALRSNLLVGHHAWLGGRGYGIRHGRAFTEGDLWKIISAQRGKALSSARPRARTVLGRVVAFSEVKPLSQPDVPDRTVSDFRCRDGVWPMNGEASFSFSDLERKSLIVGDLRVLMAKGNLVLQPSRFSAETEWKSPRESDVIEALLRIDHNHRTDGSQGRARKEQSPITVVLHTDEKGRLSVVGGQQILITILSFIEKHCGTDGTETASEYYPIDAERRSSRSAVDNLMNLPIDCRIISADTSPDVVFHWYMKINKLTGMGLHVQAVRNAAFRGDPYIDMLSELADHEKFIAVVQTAGIAREDLHYDLMQLALRAFAFKHLRSPITNVDKEACEILNREILRVRTKDDLSWHLGTEQRLKFCTVMEIVHSTIFTSHIDTAPFRRWWDPSGKGPLETSVVWDALVPVLLRLLDEHAEKGRGHTSFKERVKANTLDIQAAYRTAIGTPHPEYPSQYLFGDAQRLSSGSLDERQAVLYKALNGVLDYGREMLDPVRTFPRDLRPVLHAKQNGMCPLCGEPILDEDVMDGGKSHLDHIEPHSLGGRTELQNAQLTHAKCNLQKGNKMIEEVVAQQASELRF